MKRLQPIADKQQVELVLESFRPVTAEIDEVKLTLAFTNLIENAIKYLSLIHICVYICGQVANPGVYRVKPGARVCELVDMAGGMLDTADKSFWNLASELYDGQMLYFPTVEELKSDHIPEGTYTTGIDGSLMKGGAEDVSYTHLDVYKRQALLTMLCLSTVSERI